MFSSINFRFPFFHEATSQVGFVMQKTETLHREAKLMPHRINLTSWKQVERLLMCMDTNVGQKVQGKGKLQWLFECRTVVKPRRATSPNHPLEV